MRDRKKSARASRDVGGFAAIPWSVLDSHAYQTLSHPAKALLMEIARQYHGNDNGRMITTLAYLKPRGWTSTRSGLSLHYAQLPTRTTEIASQRSQ